MASAKLRAVMAGQDEEASMDMSPMIDMVFLLLIFFMVSSHMIVVKIDKNVKPPKAKNAQVAESAVGRIVVNIYDDGTVKDTDGNELTTSDQITDYVDSIHQVNIQNQVKSRLHVRADKLVDTKYIKKVVQAAGEAGVVQVIFGSYAID
ncbi:MAG: biopolymer transporter ExbD [Verrucomicrobiales bacterium]|nr:biopolymer transporter ExbD [Verrucomicrobiales bacterium]